MQGVVLGASSVLLAACRPFLSSKPTPTIPAVPTNTSTQVAYATATPTSSPPAAATVAPTVIPTKTPPTRPTFSSGMIRPSDDGHGFVVNGSNQPFVPIGCNYFDPQTGWAPRIWERYDHARVARQFELIASAGFTVIRVFLDLSTLNPLLDYYSEKGFAKVDDMIKIASEAGLRIIFSGPNTWQGTPAHLAGDRYTDPRVVDRINALWSKIAERYGQSQTIMTWDLLNEPSLGWPSYEANILPGWRAHVKTTLGLEVTDKLPAPDAAGQERNVWCEYVRYQESLAEEWVRSQVEILRKAGALQMISVGLIQWSIPVFLPRGASYSCFNPQRIAPYLDYMSIHFYPMLRQPDLDQEIDLQRAYLQTVVRGAHVPGKPLVLEEFGWKGGKQVPREAVTWPQSQQVRWGEVAMAATRDVCSGWLNWAFADAASPNADLSAASGLWTENEEIKDWGLNFSKEARALSTKPPAFAPAQVSWRLDLCEHLYRFGGYPSLDWLAVQMDAQPSDSVEVIFS
ncbi:MAG: cellulase family glycosylhydrolase [Anaerolineae bacterium]